MPDAGPSVFIVDDHSFFRAGLRSILSEHGFEVAGDVPSGAAALPLIARRRPDAVLMDLNMPEMSGVEATRRICGSSEPPVVLVLTVSTAEADVIDALEAGATGYLLKDSPPEEITGAIRAALNGDIPLAPRIARTVVDRARARPGGMGSSRPSVALSPREEEVLRLLAQGLDNGEIAARLFLSATTVKHHVSTIFAKLGVANRVQAAIKAARAGLV